MITLLVDRLGAAIHANHYRRHAGDRVHHGHHGLLHRRLVASLMSRLKVVAAEAEDPNHSKPDDTHTADHKKLEPSDLTSREYYQQMKTMTIWQTLKHLWNRKIDKTDPKYLEQFVRPGETGWDRINLMFSEYFSGEDNPEMHYIVEATGLGFLFGAIYGGVVSNKMAVFDFIRRHNEHTFRGELEARRKIRDTMYVQFCRYAFRWGWRTALFTGGLMGLTTLAITYRNQVYISDCIISSALLCSLWKMKLGLRAMAVSGVMGGVFGALFGGSIKLILWTMNTTVPEYRHWRHLRYRGYLEPEVYSDGTTEFGWETEAKDASRQPDYQTETAVLRQTS